MLECMALAVLPPRSQRGKRRRQRNRPCGSKDGSVQRAANAHSNGNIMATHMDRFRPNSPINTTHVVVDFVPHTTRRRGAQALFQPPTGWSRRRWTWVWISTCGSRIAGVCHAHTLAVEMCPRIGTHTTVLRQACGISIWPERIESAV
jgi:hypothetical protein